MAYPEHEGYEPASEGDFDADVAEEEDGADPCYGVAEGFFGAGIAVGGVRLGVGEVVGCACCVAEGGGAEEELGNGYADLESGVRVSLCGGK